MCRAEKPSTSRDFTLKTLVIIISEIRHKGHEYSGEHEAIISAELWDAVQTKLREHQPDYRKIGGHRNETAIAKSRLIHPLKGFLFGLDGQALTPTYTNKMFSQLYLPKDAKDYLANLRAPALIKAFSVRQLIGVAKAPASERAAAFQRMRADCERHGVEQLN